MSHGENIVKLRQMFNDAIAHGVYGRDSDNTQATLLQILNEAERMRKQCISQAEKLKQQAKEQEGKAEAFTLIPSIVESVLNGYIRLAKKDAEELDRLRREKEEAEAEEAVEAAAEAEEAIDRVTEGEEEEKEQPTVEEIKKRRKGK